MALTTVPTPLVLARLNNALPIVDPKSGLPSPIVVQTINNAFQNIVMAFAELAKREDDLAGLLAQIVALNGLVTFQQDQVTAILANLQKGSITAAITIRSSVSGSVG